jgi:hypothetical protein
MFVSWTEITGQRYDEMFDMVPPALDMAKGFLMGEASDHDPYGLPRFKAFLHHEGRFYECAQPMTRGQFRDYSPQHLNV